MTHQFIEILHIDWWGLHYRHLRVLVSLLGHQSVWEVAKGGGWLIHWIVWIDRWIDRLIIGWMDKWISHNIDLCIYLMVEWMSVLMDSVYGLIDSIAYSYHYQSLTTFVRQVYSKWCTYELSVPEVAVWMDGWMDIANKIVAWKVE
jgi:hypothetical protein